MLFVLSWVGISLLFAIMITTAEAITGLLIYWMQKHKTNDSIKTKLILLVTYTAGAIAAMIIAVECSVLWATIFEISLFLLVIYITNNHIHVIHTIMY
jgi:hypothetical protein